MMEASEVAQENGSACCGGPAPQETEACCVADARAKSAGEPGCGCGTTKVETQEPVSQGPCCG